MDVAIDLHGLRGDRFDPHFADRPAARVTAQVPGPQQQVGGAAQAAGEAAPGYDQQVEVTVAGIDGPPRADEPRDDLARVRDEDEVAVALEGLAIRRDDEIDGCETEHL